MISANALIEKFRYALDNRWGYIWGTAGILWTKAKQQQKVDYMVNKYGTSWEKNSEAKQDNYYMAAKYGSKWIGSYVADCSGLFAWAFKQLGGSIAHGSNSIYDRYCSSKGKITDDIRKNMKPGTAVFVDKNGNKSHIGLYVGNGKVIEAEGTIAGVCTSNVTAGKWTYWGELKDVDYSGAEPTPVPVTKPTIKKGSTGPYVVECQKDLIALGYDVGPTGADGKFGNNTEKAVKAFQKDNGLVADGIVGSKTWAALDAAVAPLPDPTPPSEELYTVSVHHLDKSQAAALMANYPGSTLTKE